jgi:hypothetical protein
MPAPLAALLATLLIGGAPALGAQGTSPPPIREVLATFAGAVLADSSERPIAGAVIAIDSLGRTTRTDSLGQFTLAGLPAGTHRATVRAVGHDPLTVDLVLTRGQRLEADLLLVATPPALRAVKVTAEAGARTSVFLADFESRRRFGMGRFITGDQLLAERDRSLSSILRTRVPGLQAIRFGGKTALASARGAISLRRLPRGDLSDIAQGATPACYVQVIVNDIVRYRSTPGETLLNIDQFDAAFIEAIEYYSVAQTPPEFNRGSTAACGTLVLWLRP